ncbi:MAG: hypothetical protein JXA69_10210 [Phycisphaerae bacterium]|nr:hypothetical protein [Phycisphaerae bacterium]
MRLAVGPVAGPVPPLSSAAVELDCRAGGSPSEAVLIPAALNTGGMVVAECFGIVTEVLAGATEDLAVITFKDTDDNPLNIMLTTSDNGADAVNDILVPSGTTVTLWAGSTGAPAAVVPAGKGIKAVVTQATSGTGAAGKVKVLVKAVSLGG